jgi:hypothetical protein
MTSRMSRLDQMAQKMGTSKLPQSQSSPASSGGGFRPAVAPPSPTELIESLSLGLVVAPPEELPNEIRRLWSVAHEALRSREVGSSYPVTLALSLCLFTPLCSLI